MKTCVVLAALAGAAVSACGANFGQGNLVVVRLGDQGGTLSGSAQRVYLDEYTPTGILVQSVPMPTTVSGANRRLTMSGTATSEGELTRSADGRYLVLAGYDADPGTASVSTSSTTNVSRVAARVDLSGAVDTSTAIADAFSGSSVRGAASNDGGQYWLTGGSGGIRYTTYQGASSTQINTVNSPSGLTPITNSRCVNIFGGQLYVSAAQSTGRTGVFTIDTGLPTAAGSSNSILPGTGGITGQSPYDFILTGNNTLYVADDSAVAGVGGLQKFIFSAGTWTRTDTFVTGLPTGARLRQLTSTTDASGQTVIYATTSFAAPGGPDATAIMSLVDIGAGSSFTQVAVGPSGTVFRGIEVTPVPAPGALALLGLGGLAATRRRR